MLETLLNLFANYKKTCSITKLRSGCVSFARDESYMKYIRGQQIDAWVIVPWGMSPESTKYYWSKNPEYEFTLFHNHINKENTTASIVGSNCNIHETAILGAEGLKVVNAPDGSKIPFIHTGNVIIENDVCIGPYSIVHRGTMDNTTIKAGCRFGAYTNIGHNCYIGKNTVMAAGAILNGGVKVGKNCWFASGVLIKNHISICDNVVIGLGSVVVKDITEPGIYAGSPAAYLKPLGKGWNF